MANFTAKPFFAFAEMPCFFSAAWSLYTFRQCFLPFKSDIIWEAPEPPGWLSRFSV